MMISKQELIDMDACSPGLERFILQTNNTEESVDVDTLIGGHNTLFDLMWLAGETLPKAKIVRFACDCALINIELIRPYTNKYDLIVGFLKNPSVAYANAARDSARDAANAAYAARAALAAAAADAVRSYAAASAAVRSARDVAIAAAAAAADAVAANAGSLGKVNELLVELFK